MIEDHSFVCTSTVGYDCKVYPGRTSVKSVSSMRKGGQTRQAPVYSSIKKRKVVEMESERRKTREQAGGDSRMRQMDRD